MQNQTEKRQHFFVIAFNITTIFLWGVFVYAFFTKQSIEIPWSVVDLYLLVLTFYATDKEFRRWRHEHRSTRSRGEYITIGWAATLLFMFGAEIAGGGRYGYSVPPHMSLAVGGVVIIYFITQYLKAEFGRGFASEPSSVQSKAAKARRRSAPARR